MEGKTNYIRSNTLGIALILILLLAGCAPSSAATPCPTSERLSCPTAVACPTAAEVKIPSGESVWAQTLQGASMMTITFDAGEKCTVSLGQGNLYSGTKIYYNIKVNDPAHATYAVIFQTLDEGKTLADLQAYSKTARSAPGWDSVFRENYVGPGSNSFYSEDFSKGQIYISCFVSQKSGILRILDYGPVEIK
jgi:hypothetical protein